MSRKPRIDVAGKYYHCMNRTSGRIRYNLNKKDYELFLRTLQDAQRKFNTQVLAYAVMPNHFHLVIRTREDGELGRFMHWLASVHTRRWHTFHKTLGTGHLYQGRFKSVVIEDERQLLTTIEYVEANPLRAGLVKSLEDWKYSSYYEKNRKRPGG